MDIFEGLSERQREAVETIDDDLEIIACAGAGKTGVVTRRIVNILKSNPGVLPENIVAFTFTKKAAEELKGRINAYGKSVLGHTKGFAHMYVGTIHGFCIRMLQDYIPEFQKFTVLDEIQTKLFVERYNCIDETGIYFPSDISWPGGGGPKYEVLHPVTGKPVKVPNRGWVYPTKERMEEVISQNLVHFGKDESSVPCKKTYLASNETSTPYSVFYKDGRAATKRLRSLMGEVAFQNPKDVDILSSIFEFSSNNDSIILDFFAGSGSTAQAVMELNRKDGGNRQFILCTNNENNIST